MLNLDLSKANISGEDEARWKTPMKPLARKDKKITEKKTKTELLIKKNSKPEKLGKERNK